MVSPFPEAHCNLSATKTPMKSYKHKAEGIDCLPLLYNLNILSFLLIARCYLEPQNTILFELSFALFPIRHKHGKKGVELFGVIGMNQVA